MVQAVLIKKTPYSDKFGSGIEFLFNSGELPTGEYKSKKNNDYLNKENNLFLNDLQIGSYVDLVKNDKGAGYFINKSKSQPEKPIQKNESFEMKDPSGVFAPATVNTDTKFDYAEKAFNKAYDIVTNKVKKTNISNNSLETTYFTGEDIRTMINVVYMQIMK